MSTGPCVLAVDLGTSGPKAALVSATGRIVATARAHVDTLFLPHDGAEQDPAAIWTAVKTACSNVLRLSGVTPGEVFAVICSSQYSSIVPVDANGQPTMNMILWMDRRGATARLRKLPSYPRRADTPLQLLQWLRIHGLPPVAAGLSLNHMRFIKYARPEVYARTAAFLEPMDYLTLCFTGRATANQCTVSMMLLTDNRELDVTRYDPRLLRYAGIDAAKLPELLHLDAVAGTVRPDVASELGLSPTTKVITGVNDTQAGGLATAAYGGRHAAISIGSTSVMITHVDRKRTDPIHAIFSMPSPVPRTWFVMAENGTGGATLEHFLENLIGAGEPATGPATGERFAILQRAIDETPPGSGGVLFLPWMSGSIAPAADEHVRGGFLNLGLKTTRSHMARAVLEGVAMNLRWLRRPVERFARREFSHFVFYGGGAQSDAWSQILADVLQAPVHQVENPEYLTCLGVGLLALERLGLIGFDEFQQLSPIRRIYQPRADTRAVYDAMFVQFVRAFRKNRSIFRALNRNQEQS